MQLKPTTKQKLRLYNISTIYGGEIQEAETSYKTSVQQEAEVFTQKWREEVQYHANSSAQAQSVLSAERQQHQRDLKEQAERWAGVTGHGDTRSSGRDP